MPAIERKSDKALPLDHRDRAAARVANREKKMPRRFITKDGFGITAPAAATSNR